MSNSNKNPGTIGRRRLLQASAVGLGGLAVPWVARPAGAQSQLAGKTIGFSTSWVTAEWNRQQRQGVIDTAQKFGFKCIVLDAENHPDKEVSNLEDLVTRGVDAILINTYFTEAIAPAVREINHAKIPIIVLSSALKGDVDWTVQLSADTPAAARTAGEYFVRRLNGKGNVIEIDGSPGSTVNQERGRYWHEVVDKAAGIKVVGTVMADYDRLKALKGMEDMLQAHDKIDGVYTHSEAMALGAIQAIREVGREKEMFVAGYDGVAADCLKALYDGELAMVMSYHPFGVEAVEVAARVFQGKPTPKNIVFATPMIDKNNIVDYYDPATGKAKIGPSRLVALNLPDK